MTEKARPASLNGAPMPKADADKMVRYCPECGRIGPVKPPAKACCPDSFGMSLRRWQAEKMERMLERLRSAISDARGVPIAQAPQPVDGPSGADWIAVGTARVHKTGGNAGIAWSVESNGVSVRDGETVYVKGNAGVPEGKTNG